MEQEKDTFTIPHFRDYWFIIAKSKKTIVISVILVTLIGFLGMGRKGPVYETRAKILLGSGLGIYTSTITKMQMVGIYRENYMAHARKYENEYELMKSTAVAKKAAEMLGWEGRDKNALNAVQINPVREGYKITNVAFIIGTSPDPKKAMDMTNYTAKAYIAIKETEAREKIKKIYGVYAQQLKILKKNLRDSEIAFDEFKKKYNIVSMENIKIDGTPARSLAQQLINIRIRITRLNSLLKSLKSLESEEDVSGIYGIVAANYPDAVNRNLHKEMVERKKKLLDLLTIYTEKHPLVIQQRAQVEGLKKPLKDDLKKSTANLNAIYNMLKAEEENIMYSLGLKSPDLGTAKTRYYTLEREVSSNRDLYDNLISGMKELNIYEEMSGIADVKVLEWAKLPSSPVKRKNIILFFSPILGLFFGISLVFFFEYMDNTIKTEADIKQYLNLSIIGVIPHIEEDEDKK